MPPNHTLLQPSHRRWLQLIRLPGLGPSTLAALWRTFGSSHAIINAAASQLAEAGLAPHLAQQLLNLDDSAITAEHDAIEAWLGASRDHHLLSLDDAAYPDCLRQIADPPPLLYLHGDPALLQWPQLALVGSRNASASGQATAFRFAKQLSQAGLIPISGLAQGIDAAAHRGALEGFGLTVAVLGTGVDRIYPARHAALAQQIVAQGGVLVSELALGSPARAAHFPRRNRIISGLSRAVVVVEAALKSGSLITARLALEQGRELFAVPGVALSCQNRGCHQLIRQGAVLVDEVSQVLEELAPQLGNPPLPPQHESGSSSRSSSLSPQQRQVLQAVGFETTPLERVLLRAELPAALVQAELMALELEGCILSVTGGYQRIADG